MEGQLFKKIHKHRRSFMCFQNELETEKSFMSQLVICYRMAEVNRKLFLQFIQ